MKSLIFVMCLVLAVGFSGLSSADQSDDPTPAQKKKTIKPDLIKFTFPEQMGISVLIEYVSKRLDVNILYDDKVLKEQITILSPAEIPTDSLLSFLQGVLKMTGYSLVKADQPGWMKIISNKSFLDVTKDFERDVSALKTTKDMTILSQVFQLKYANVEDADKIVKPFLSKPGGNSMGISEKNLLIVTDYTINIRRIVSLIALIDRPAEEIAIHFIALKHVGADNVSKQVLEMFKQKNEVTAVSGGQKKKASLSSWLAIVPEPRTNQLIVVVLPKRQKEVLDFIKALDVPAGLETQRYHFSYISPQRVMGLVDKVIGEDFKGRYRSAMDEDSGLLIVSGPADIHDEISSLKKELDVPESDPEHRDIRFYKIRNTTAAEVLSTISALDPGAILSVPFPQKQGKPRSGLAAEPFAGPNVPPPSLGKALPKPPVYRPGKAAKGPKSRGFGGLGADEKSRTIVTADPNTNTIIVIAPPEVHKMYERLIKELDKRRPQVMVSVTMVTLDTTDDFALGVELAHSGSLGKDKNYLVFSSFGLSTVDPTIVDPVAGNLSIIPGIGFNGAIINPSTFNAIVRALEKDDRAEIISVPRVLVNDNATATLTSISEQPFTSVNASETVSTTSFGGYASAGSTLTVTPHISEGDHLQLEYTVTLNSFAGEGEGGIPAPRQTNELTSQVTIPDGYTVVVGGLNRKDTTDSVAKLPWLGDIPFLGHAFSLTENSQRKSTLFVFIRPVILRDDEFKDLKYLSERDLEITGPSSNFPKSNPIIMN